MLTLIIFSIYFLIGIEYSYQYYKKMDLIDDLYTPKQVFVAGVLVPLLWGYFKSSKIIIKFRERRNRIYK